VATLECLSSNGLQLFKTHGTFEMEDNICETRTSRKRCCKKIKIKNFFNMSVNKQLGLQWMEALHQVVFMASSAFCKVLILSKNTKDALTHCS
jgi:hypothetical protein